MTDETNTIEVPSEVNIRLETWKRWWRFFLYAHYLLGVIGVLASTLWAALPDENGVYRTASAIVAACVFAIIGFVSPESRYLGLVRAWRTLDVARARYKKGYLKLQDLFDILERCETIATEPSRHDLTPEQLGFQSTTSPNHEPLNQRIEKDAP